MCALVLFARDLFIVSVLVRFAAYACFCFWLCVCCVFHVCVCFALLFLCLLVCWLCVLCYGSVSVAFVCVYACVGL